MSALAMSTDMSQVGVAICSSFNIIFTINICLSTTNSTSYQEDSYLTTCEDMQYFV
jgi:hypothetical protein